MEITTFILQNSISLITLITIAYGLWRMIAATEEARRARAALDAKMTGVVANVGKVELATNSMKDALVAATAKAAHLEGVREGTEAEIARNKDAQI